MRPASQQSWRRHLASCTFVAALVLLSYGSSLFGDYVWDDRPLIVENRQVQEPDRFAHLLTSSFWETGDRHDHVRNFYRPLTSVTYAADFAIWGLKPLGFHITNLLLHLACCYLVYAVVFKEGYGEWIATTAAALFATHPVHVESVAWISGRTDLLCALFMLMAFLLHRAAAEREGGRAARIGACAAFLVALSAKEMAATLPILVALDRWLSVDADRRGRVTAALNSSWPFLAVLAGYFLVRHAMVGPPAQPLYHLGPLAWASTTLFVVGRYVTLLLLPLGLDAHYPYEPLTTLLAPTALLGGGILAVALFGTKQLVARNPRAGFWALWTLVSLAPVLAFGRFGDVILADRFLYIPSIGAAVLGAMGLAWFLETRPRRVRATVCAIAVLAIVALAFGSQRRCRIWRDDFELFSSMAQTSPTSALVRSNLGLAYYRRGDLVQAVHEFRRAIEATPSYAMAHNNLAAALEQQSRKEEALHHYWISLDLAPGQLEPTINAGHLLTRVGRAEEGLTMLRRVVREHPDLPGALYALAETLDRLGFEGSALPYLERAVEADPGYANAYYLIGKIRFERGQKSEAANAMHEFLARWPEEDRFARRAREILAQSGSRAPHRPDA